MFILITLTQNWHFLWSCPLPPNNSFGILLEVTLQTFLEKNRDILRSIGKVIENFNEISKNFQFSWRGFADIMVQLGIIINCEEIFKKTVGKHWSTEVNIPKCSVKFWNRYVKILQQFLENLEEILQKCKSWKNLSNTWKKTEKIFENLQKN